MMKSFAAALSTLLFSACSIWRPTTVPLRTIEEPAHCGHAADTLLVMLPGSWSKPEEFQQEGFVDAVRSRRIAADMLLVDAHTGYYADRSIVERLSADVIEPALAKGYRQVWLVGISIGGFGSLIYAEQRPKGIAGVVLLGPYLGKRGVATEIASQGGLAAWRAPAGVLDPEDVDNAVWRWLQPYAGMAEAPAGKPRLYLGYGRDDRFLFSDTLLAGALPASHVFSVEGGHDWPAWRDSWARMLDAMPLPRDAACIVPALPAGR